jgi:hypothetical protein
MTHIGRELANMFISNMDHDTFKVTSSNEDGIVADVRGADGSYHLQLKMKTPQQVPEVTFVLALIFSSMIQGPAPGEIMKVMKSAVQFSHSPHTEAAIRLHLQRKVEEN